MKTKTRKTETEKDMKRELDTEMPVGRVFEVTVTETLQRKIRVHESELKEATPDDAEQTARDWWQNGQVILGPEDFKSVQFDVAEVTGGGGGDA